MQIPLAKKKLSRVSNENDCTLGIQTYYKITIRNEVDALQLINTIIA